METAGLCSGYGEVDAKSNLVGLPSHENQYDPDVTLCKMSSALGKRPDYEENRSSSALSTGQSGTCNLDQEKSPVDDSITCSASSISAAPVCRQFWKAGVYNDELTPKSTTQIGSSYLHIHPKFLHSNATSHKWAFGAIAELLDNAVDEIQNGATYVLIDKTSNPRNGSPALLMQDDGGGMDPEAMRRCLSFGFSDKKSKSTIGKYGNGFKTSSMRLGADVIVFSRHLTDRTLTQSIGLLSYTFLTKVGYDRIVVPMVHYDFNFTTGSFQSLQSQSKEHGNVNLSVLLEWSPYSTEEEMLKQFDDVGSHGTKIIIYNLWLDDEGTMELDFGSDPKDIRIAWEGKSRVKDDSLRAISEYHLAKRLRYSLSAYLSVLYLRLPETFCILLRGQVVLYHNIATDLKHPKFILYKPHSGGGTEGMVVTTIGFVKEAPNVNVHGFNIYHKNRLILPFFAVINLTGSRGRGIVGVLEANFIEPTHNKQDFEKTSVFQKLVTRLKDMTMEYWDYHCGLIGYQPPKKARPPSVSPGSSNPMHRHATQAPVPLRNSSVVGTPILAPIITNPMHQHATQAPVPLRSSSVVGTPKLAPIITNVTSREALFANSSVAKPLESTPHGPRGLQDGTHMRRKSHDEPEASQPMARVKTNVVNTESNTPDTASNQKRIKLLQENKRLRDRCSEHEKTEENLKLKVRKLKSELGEAQEEYGRLMAELQCVLNVKVEIIK